MTGRLLYLARVTVFARILLLLIGALAVIAFALANAGDGGPAAAIGLIALALAVIERRAERRG